MPVGFTKKTIGFRVVLPALYVIHLRSANLPTINPQLSQLAHRVNSTYKVIFDSRQRQRPRFADYVLGKSKTSMTSRH